MEPSVCSVEHRIVEASPTTVCVQPEPTPSTSVQIEQPSRTFAVTGTVHEPEDIDKVDVIEEAPRVVTCVTTVVAYPPGTVSVGQDSGSENTSVTYVVHHEMPGKMALGDLSMRSNDTPYRDLRTDLAAETPSLDIKKMGKMRSGDYGPILETVTYVVCYQVGGGPDEQSRNVINELHLPPNYTITGRVGLTSSIEDTAESYTLTGLSGGPPPYSEEHESLYLAILNYAARSQDNWQREVPGRVTYITQQDFPKATDTNTLSLSRKGPTIEATEPSPPPSPTPDDNEIWVKQRVVVVEAARAEAEPPTTTADVFSEAMDIVQQADVDVDTGMPPVRTEYRGWRRDDEVNVRKPAADVVMPRYEVEVCAEVSADDNKELYLDAEASPLDEVVEFTTEYRPDYPPDEVAVSEQWPKSSDHFDFRAAAEIPEVSHFSEANISTTRTYVFHEQLPTTDVISGTEPVTSKVDVTRTPVAAYVKVTTAGSDTTSRTYVVHREWPSLQPPVTGLADLDTGTYGRTLAEALGSSAPEGDVATATYVVRYDWPKLAKPPATFEAEGRDEFREVADVMKLQEDVPPMYVVSRRESPPPTTARYEVAVPAETDVGMLSVDEGHRAESPLLELPENCISCVYIVRHDWPLLKVPQPEVGQRMSVHIGCPSDIGPAPTGDMTMKTYVVHYDWPIVNFDLPMRQPPASDVLSVSASVTEAEEVKVATAATAAAPSIGKVFHSYTTHYDWPTNRSSDIAMAAPKPRVTFAPAVIETNLDLITQSPETPPKITYEVKHDLMPETMAEPLAVSAAAIQLEQAEVRVPEISMAPTGPKLVETMHDSSLERDWPWFKRDTPAIRPKDTVPDVPPPVAIKVSPGVSYSTDGFYVDTSTEVPSRELMTKTYIVHRNWPELKLEVLSRTVSDIGLTGALMSDTNHRDITYRTYVVNYEWPPVKTKPTLKDDGTDTAVDVSASASAEDDGELSPTYLARIERSRVKIHLPGPDRSREAEVEVIPPEPEDEPTVPAPPGDNIVSHTYIVYHDWPLDGLLLSEPKSDLNDEDLFASRQMDTVTYIVHFDPPSRKVKKYVEDAPETFSVEPPDIDVQFSASGGTHSKFIADDIDLPSRELPGVSVVRPPEPKHAEFEQRSVEVICTVEPQARPHFETDIDEVTGSGVDDFTVQYDLPAAKFQLELEPIHVREPAIAVVAQEPVVDHRLRFETDIDIVTEPAEPVVVAAADVDVPPSVTFIRAVKDEDSEPTPTAVIAPTGDLDTHTYITHHDWPRVKLTLSEPQRRLESVDEADRQLVARTYIVHYDWPTLKIQVPATEPPTRIVLEEPPERREEAARPSELLPSLVFHYMPEVETQKSEPIRIREPSTEVNAMRDSEVTDVEVGAAVAAPSVTYIPAGHEGDIAVTGEATSSSELNSHTYIVHHDWPAGITKIVSVLPESETLPEPQPPTIAVCPTPPAIQIETHIEKPAEVRLRDEPIAVTEAAGRVDIVPVAPAGDMVSRTYIVHHDWPTVQLTFSEPKRSLESNVETDRHDIISRTYVVHYEWPSLKVKVIQPPEPPARVVIEEPAVTVHGEAEVDVVATVSEPLPTVLVQQEVDLPEVKVDEAEPVEIPEPIVQMIAEPMPDVDLRIHYETDIDAAIAEPSTPPVAAAVVPVPVMYVDKAKDEPVEPAVSVVEPPADLDSHTYIVHHNWPRVKLTLSEPQRRLESVDEADHQLVSRTYIVHYDWPTLKLQLPATEPSTRIVVQEPERREEAAQPAELLPSLVFHYMQEVETPEPEPVLVREPSIEVITTRDDVITDVEVGAAVAAPKVTYIPSGHEADIAVTGKTLPSGKLTSHTYIVHHDWPHVKLTLSEPKRIWAVHGDVEDIADSVPGTLERNIYVVHYDWPTRGRKIVSVLPESETLPEPQPPTIAVCPMPPAIQIETHDGEPAEEVTAAEVRLRDEPFIVTQPAAGVDIESVSPAGHVVSRTYIVHHDWPTVHLTVSGPKRSLESDVETDRCEIVSRTYIVHYDWPSLKVKIIQPPEPSARVVIEEPAVGVSGETEVDVVATVGEHLPTVLVQQEVDLPEVEIQEAEPVEIPEPIVQMIAEPQPEVDLRIRYETDIDAAIAELSTPPAAVAAVAATYVDEGKDEYVESKMAVVAPSADTIVHTYIVHHNWPRVKLIIPEPKGKLGLADNEGISAPSGKVISLTYIVNWPSLKGKEQPRITVTQPVSVKARVDEEPRPSADVQIVVEPATPSPSEVEVEAAITAPDVPPSVVPSVVTGDKEIVVPSIASISVATGDTVSRTYIVHHDWPRVTLVAPVPKRRLDAAAEDVNVDRITYVVHYDWPAIQIKRPSEPELSAGAAIQAIDSGTDVSGEVDIGVVAKPTAQKVTRTFIVHYDWPTGKAKVEMQPPAGELEATLKIKPEIEPLAVEIPEIMQPSPPDVSFEISQPQEPVTIDTVVVTVPVLEEQQQEVPPGEVTWQLPETDVNIKPPPEFDSIPHLQIEAEPPVCTVGDEVTPGADFGIEPSPLVAVAAVDLSPITVAETKHVEPPVSAETLTFVVQPEVVSVEAEALKEPQEDLGPETITYEVTYDVSKKEAGKPTEIAVRVERRRSSAEEVPSAAKVEAPEEETIKYTVEYKVDVVKGRFPKLFVKKVPTSEAPEVLPAPSPVAEVGIAAEGPGIPVQRQLSETVNVDYEAVKITGPAVIMEGSIEAPHVVVPSPYDEQPEVAVAAAVAASVPTQPSEFPSEAETVTYIVSYDLPDVGVTRVKKLELSLVRKDEETKPEQIELAATGREGSEVPVSLKQPSEEKITYVVTYEYIRTKQPKTLTEPVSVKPEIEKDIELPAVQDTEVVVSAPAAFDVAEVEPGLVSEVVCIRGPEEMEPPKISLDEDVLVVQPSVEVQPKGDVEIAVLPAVEGVEEMEKTVPQAGVAVELERPHIDVSVLSSDVEIQKTAVEMRVGPAPEVEVEVPAVETVQEAAAPPETDTVTFIVHYDELTIGGKASPDDVSLKKRRRDEIRVLLRPLHEPLAADDVTSASDLESLRHLVVVAIDIGTTFSGYAFTLAGKTHGKDEDDEDKQQQQQQQQRPQHSIVSIIVYFAM